MRIYPIYPMAVAQRMIEAHGGTTEELFKRCNITPEEYSNPNTLLTAQQTNESINICKDYSEKSRLISVQFLKHMHFSDLGALGMAMINSENMRQAFNTLLKFQAIYAPTFYIVENKYKAASTFVIQNEVSIGSNNHTVLEIVVGIFSLIHELIQFNGQPIKASLQHTKPTDFHEGDFAGLEITWQANNNQVTISHELMDKKMVGRNPANYTLFENILTEQLKKISDQTPYTRGVESCIQGLIKTGSTVSLEEVSRSVNISSRTLNRRLAHEQTTFQELYTQRRLNHAAQLLKTTKMPIKQISSAAGYTAQASFYKAFKGFFKCSPDQYRNQP